MTENSIKMTEKEKHIEEKKYISFRNYLANYATKLNTIETYISVLIVIAIFLKFNPSGIVINFLLITLLSIFLELVCSVDNATTNIDILDKRYERDGNIDAFDDNKPMFFNIIRICSLILCYIARISLTLTIILLIVK